MNFSQKLLKVAQDHLDQFQCGNAAYLRTVLFPYLEERGLRKSSNWCAAFVNICAMQVAKELNVPMPFTPSLSAKGLRNEMRHRGYFGDVALPGAVVVWHRGSPKSWTGHIGIVKEVFPEYFTSIEGNVSNKIMEKQHQFADKKLLGFGLINI